MNVLTPTLGLGVGYSERYVQQSKCSNVSTKTLMKGQGDHSHVCIGALRPPPPPAWGMRATKMPARLSVWFSVRI